MLKLTYLCLYLFLAFQIEAASDSLDFTIENNSTSVSFSLSTGGSEQGTVSYSGNILATVDYDEESLTPIGFTFTGGEIATSDTDFSVTSLINITGAGYYNTTIGIVTKGLVATPSTINSPGFVSPTDHSLNSNEHKQTVFKGTTSISATVLGIREEEEVDFDKDPETLDSENQMTINIVETESNPIYRTLLFTLTINVNGSETTKIDNTNASMTFSETGAYTSVATKTIHTEFGLWSLNHGLDLPTPDNANQYGIPYALLYALDLNPNTSVIPLAINEGYSPNIEIQLPANGLKFALIPQYTNNLSSGEWLELPSEFLMNGPNSFQTGSSGVAKIAFPNSYPSFIRIATETQSN